MIYFFFRNLSSSWTRTISIIITTFISTCIGFIFYLLFINIVSGIEYYTLDGIDEKRFSITAGSNIFQIFDREKGGIPDTIVQKIANDNSVERYREFRFLDISVLGKFDLFKFSLDIDIPTFSVRDSMNNVQGIGISSQMLKYYNLELAGSHALFPLFTESDIIGRNVSLVFGASKLFSLPEKSVNTYTSTITHVDTDYPGFGVVIPFEIAETKMSKLGYKQNNPYKIVGYMKDTTNFAELVQDYSGYTITFDKDKIVQHKQTLEVVRSILVSVMVGILIVLYCFLFLLFSGYFREKSYILLLIKQLKIENSNRYILVFLEPILLIFFGFISYVLVCIIGQGFIIDFLQSFFYSKNILFPLIKVTFESILIIGVFSMILNIGLLLGTHLFKKE